MCIRDRDVPLAEIREMLEGQSTLAEGMNRQLERLSTCLLYTSRCV